MPPDELTGTEPRYNLWLSQEDAELLAMVVAGSGKIWDKPVRLFTTRTLTYSRVPRPAQRVHVRTAGPRRRRVTSGPRKARAPDDDGSSGHLGEPEESSGCSTSPQQFDLLDAVALSLGWERAA
jgi:hypothetical protein